MTIIFPSSCIHDSLSSIFLALVSFDHRSALFHRLILYISLISNTSSATLIFLFLSASYRSLRLLPPILIFASFRERNLTKANEQKQRNTETKQVDEQTNPSKRKQELKAKKEKEYALHVLNASLRYFRHGVSQSLLNLLLYLLTGTFASARYSS